ncbi:MAG TPA: glycosyltransferase family 1 protein [Dehalococcoidia bacterium]|nr:glycosyltransferase family 1 protein [Dehalococcoidia bacterium]
MSVRQPTRVLLLRDVPQRRLRSMERLADEIERGMDGRPGLRMTAMTVNESAIAARAGLGRLDSYAARFVRYPLAASRRRADVYHIIDHGYAHLAALLPAPRVVTSCHDLMLLRAAEGSAGFAPHRISLARFRWSVSFLRRTARVVVPTHATRGDVERLLGVAPGRISVVPYGVDARFRPLPDEARARLRDGIAPGRRLVLSVATGDPYKNVPATLRVLAALRDAGADVALVRAGTPLAPHERRLARDLRVDAAVIDYGGVSDARLVELYNACDLLLFPSFWEGYGWPPLEAMACGTPVVVSDCPALAEVAGDAALSAPAADVVALTRAVRAVLDSPCLTLALRQRGIERAARCTWRETVESFARIYEEVACGAEPSAPRAEASPACAE